MVLCHLQLLIISFKQEPYTLTAPHCHGLHWGAVLAKHLLRLMGTNTELICAEWLQSGDYGLWSLTRERYEWLVLLHSVENYCYQVGRKISNKFVVKVG